jgi:DNA-binding transcriptional regulator/RsmH inhibitor MraZ
VPPPTLFLGEFEHSIDDKSRLAVPARFRPALEDGFPQFLRAYAQLETEVVVVGLADRIEVWSRSEWERERSEAERDSAELAEHLSRD